MTWRLAYIPEPAYRLPAYTWGTDRQLCQRCAHHRSRTVNCRGSGVIRTMTCSAVRHTNGLDASCIGARTEGACGVDGKLFVAAQLNEGAPA